MSSFFNYVLVLLLLLLLLFLLSLLFILKHTRLKRQILCFSTYRFNTTNWVSFEDAESLEQKIEYLKSRSIGGVAIFSQSEDDFSGTFCNSGKFPLSLKVYQLSDVQPHIRPKLPWERYCNSGSRESVLSWSLTTLAFRLGVALVMA